MGNLSGQKTTSKGMEKMKKSDKLKIDRIIAKIQKDFRQFGWEYTWGIDPKVEIEADIKIDFTRKKAHISLKPPLPPRKKLIRIIAHEMMHTVIEPIWRGMSDWAWINMRPKTYETFAESVNTRENEVIEALLDIMGYDY